MKTYTTTTTTTTTTTSSTTPHSFFGAAFQRKRPKVKNPVICKMATIIERIIANAQALPQYSLIKAKITPFDLEESEDQSSNYNSTQKDIYTQNNLVSHKEFLYKIQQNLKCTDEFFIAAFLMIQKYLNVCPIQITDENCQRLIACAVLLLEKQYNDFEITLFSYSRAFNIPMVDLKKMEMDFIFTLNWETNISEEEFLSFSQYFTTLSI